jgi:putative thioredoxin
VVSLQDFEARVVTPSLEIPVLIDFWAEWCAPCKTLKPMLEKLAEEYGGRFLLAKVNADANPELCQYFNVRSIPAVFAIVDGQPQDAFTGALPEAELRAFINRYALPPAADPRAEAARLVEAGDEEGALAILLAAIQAHPEDEGARLDAAEILLEQKRTGEAREFLEQEYTLEADRARGLKARLALGKEAAEIAPLLQRLADAPGDHATRLVLARAYAGEGRYEEAMAAALEVARQDRGFEDDHARRTLLEFFAALEGSERHDDLVRKYRRALAALLN